MDYTLLGHLRFVGMVYPEVFDVILNHDEILQDIDECIKVVRNCKLSEDVQIVMFTHLQKFMIPKEFLELLVQKCTSQDYIESTLENYPDIDSKVGNLLLSCTNNLECIKILLDYSTINCNRYFVMWKRPQEVFDFLDKQCDGEWATNKELCQAITTNNMGRYKHTEGFKKYESHFTYCNHFDDDNFCQVCDDIFGDIEMMNKYLVVDEK